MKIENLGIRISGLPFDQVIRTEGDEIIIEDAYSEIALAKRYSVAGATEMRDALTAAIKKVSSAANGRALRSWDRKDDIPADVMIITERDGDAYFRSPTGWATRPNADPSFDTTLGDNYAPFTEVIL